jgi:Fic family protein
MRWFLGCRDRAFHRTETSLASVDRKAGFWETQAGELFNNRQQKALNRLLNGFEEKLTSSKGAGLAKSSQDMARRNIEGRGRTAPAATSGKKEMVRIW